MEITILLLTTGKIIGLVCFAAFVIFCLCIVIAHVLHEANYDEKETLDEIRKDN